MIVMATQKINGIDVDQLRKTIDDVRQTPELGAFKFRARQSWLDGAHARTTIDDFYGAGEEHEDRAQAFEIEAARTRPRLGGTRSSPASAPPSSIRRRRAASSSSGSGSSARGTSTCAGSSASPMRFGAAFRTSA